ncbi:MAG: transport system ATP-binding/permease protein, partial [Mycobacterium sp.]|nr:transport system ATP-binding/permease protein [Mycobacterium sp.]
MDDRTETVTTGTTPRLVLRAGGKTWQASGGRTYTLGRANEADIRLEN